MLKGGLVFILTAFLSLETNAGPLESFSQQDQKIYNEIFQQCQPGTVTSALKIGFNKDQFFNGLDNWMKIMGAKLDESGKRTESNGLSPQLAQIRRSPGFWLAMTDCYGYKYGEMNYGNMMKQIIDVGHLSMEVGSTTAGYIALIGGAKLMKQFSNTYPLASRFITSSLIALHVHTTLKQLQALLSDELTADEKKQLEETQKQLFAEPNRVIQESIVKSREVLVRIDEKLKDSTITEEKRANLLASRRKIQESLNILTKKNN